MTKARIVSELVKAPHGKLDEYRKVGEVAAHEDADFYAHLVAWNAANGQVRDAKVALPVIALAGVLDGEHESNALAHVAMLDPRNLLRALEMARENKPMRRSMQLRRLTERYLRAREDVEGWWDRTALQHRASMKRLYALYHIKPSHRALQVLFLDAPPVGSVFDRVRTLKLMSDNEAAGTILEHRVPFLVAAGALGERAKAPSLMLAMLERMTPTEVVTNTKMLERYGVRTNPALRAAYEAKLEEVAKSKRATLKTTRAAQQQGDAVLRTKLQAAQEKQIDAARVKGKWLILADRSGSMQHAIESARVIAATLARYAEEVHLVFFNVAPTYFDVTGKTYDEVLQMTRHVTAAGGTSIGCGLQYAVERQLEFQGVAIVSDGGENTLPLFASVYERTEQPPVYFYLLRGGDLDSLSPQMARAGHDMQTFDLRGGVVDYTSLPNLVATMRVGRYALLDEIMGTTLARLEDAFTFKART